MINVLGHYQAGHMLKKEQNVQILSKPNLNICFVLLFNPHHVTRDDFYICCLLLSQYAVKIKE